MMIVGVGGTRVGVVNPVAAVFHRIKQALVELPANQFPHAVMFMIWLTEVLDRSNFRFGECDNLNIHFGIFKTSGGYNNLKPKRKPHSAMIASEMTAMVVYVGEPDEVRSIEVVDIAATKI